MLVNSVSGGTNHDIPTDLKKALVASKKALKLWENITPLARNEWICWTVSVKRQKTRDDHVKRAVKELAEGKRRPCCWMGCVHRTDKAINSTQKWILAREPKR